MIYMMYTCTSAEARISSADSFHKRAHASFLAYSIIHV